MKCFIYILKDWNVFLESFSDVEFCIQNGSFPASIPALSTPVTTAPVQASTASIPVTDTLRLDNLALFIFHSVFTVMQLFETNV